ncbi:EcsC family protein [Sphingomonas sanguinis]|uniref:EcsC family protein n=1 Tax=Sphingomonas sp. LC-1 TaxID=3110957 RepID=UPI0021BB764C|nr:EcsC family protein [Sphingomonas sp. LC-1]MCT8003985.1 EcsC family protein [Sphingomonas sp. LC-1]
MTDDNTNKGIIKKITAIIAIEPEKILKDAQEYGIPVSCLEDFNDHEKIKRHTIERLSAKYVNNASQLCALSGAATGAGSVATVLALSAGDMGNMAAQLFRLNQKLAILNGFDPYNDIHQDKTLGIYLTAIGIEGAAQAGIRAMVAKAIVENVAKKGPPTSIGIKVILEVVKILGMTMSKRQAAKLVPFVGVALGAGVNFVFAKGAGKSLIEAYRMDAQDRADAKSE